MPPDNIGFWNWIGNYLKIIVYMCSAALGLAARLLTENEKKRLTKREYLLHTVLAASSTLVTWYLLKEAHAGMASTVICSGISARWGDSVSLLFYKWAKTQVKELPKFLDKIK